MLGRQHLVNSSNVLFIANRTVCQALRSCGMHRTSSLSDDTLNQWMGEELSGLSSRELRLEKNHQTRKCIALLMITFVMRKSRIRVNEIQEIECWHCS